MGETKTNFIMANKTAKKQALEAAFEVCFLAQDVAANVLSGLESYEESPKDQKIYDDATIFIEWYKLNYHKL